MNSIGRAHSAFRIACLSIVGAAFAVSAPAQTGTASIFARYDGQTTLDGQGMAVANAGDVDGDGFDDVVVGAPDSSRGGAPQSGAVTVYSGASGSVIWQANGTESGSRFGSAVAGVGDVDRDGYDDVLVGSPRSTADGHVQAGIAFVYSGQTGAVLWQLEGAASPEWQGYSVASAGDVDHDLYPDLLVGAPLAAPGGTVNAGAARIYSGQFGSLLRELPGAQPDDFAGFSVAGGRDFNGDGFPDQVVGALLADGGAVDSGGVTAYSGQTGLELWHSTVGASGDAFAYSLSTLADVNIDAHADVIVGAPNADPAGHAEAGSVFVLSGSNGSVVRRLDGQAAGDMFGFSVCGGGDVNGQGEPSIVVGAPATSPPGKTAAGTAYTYSGATGGELWHFDGYTSLSQQGYSVAAGGNVGGLAPADVIVGAPYATPDGGLTYPGAALVFGLIEHSGLPGYKPGALGIFVVHHTRLFQDVKQEDGGAPSAFVTLISVTNTNTAPQTPTTFGGSTNVHYEYVNATPNPADPFIPLQCAIADRVEFLTPADTLTVAVHCHNPSGNLSQEGYLVVTAQDPSQFDVDWSFNHLIGSELVVNLSGSAYELEMISFEGLTGEENGHPARTDKNRDGKQNFDGHEYSAIPDALMADSLIPYIGQQLVLVNLTGGLDARNTVHFDIWNDNEFQLSANRTFSCWFDQPLWAISPIFTNEFLAFNTPNDPAELDINCDGAGDIETAWARIQSISVRTVGGELISTDGALLGAITPQPFALEHGAHLLWESKDDQANGVFPGP